MQYQKLKELDPLEAVEELLFGAGGYSDNGQLLAFVLRAVAHELHEMNTYLQNKENKHESNS